MTEMKEWLINMGVAEDNSGLIAAILAFIGQLVFSWIAYHVVAKGIIHFLKKLANLNNTNWDNILFDQKVFKRLSHLVPAVITHYGVSVYLEDFPSVVEFIQTATYLYMVVAGLLVVVAVINGFHEIYNTLPVSKDRSVKGIVQAFKMFTFVPGLGVVLSIILKKDMTTFFAGMGAMAAVVMLVFKDSILGFVAGVQLSAYDMVRLGDWIEMPGRNAGS